MNANEYQRQCRQFDNHSTTHGLLPLALGLAAEAGEVANEFERSTRIPGHLDRDKVSRELGDVLWNVARLADELGYTLEGVMEVNINKLTRRYAERGIAVNSD